MNWSEYPGLSRLAFDTELKSFNGILSLFLNAAEKAKSSGKKVIAGAPLSPVEPVLAAGGIPYEPFSHETIFHSVLNEKYNLIDEAVAAGMSPDFSAWNLMAVGAIAAQKGRVPIDAYATICGCISDQLKKSLQAMSSITAAPLFFWEIPRFSAEFSGWSIRFITTELKQLFSWLALQTGHKITDDTLTAAIKLGNLLRQDILEINRLQQSSPAPVPSLEFYILQSTAGDHMQDGQALHGLYQALIDELKNRADRFKTGSLTKSTKKLRIYWIGEETQEYQIFNIFEDCGAVLAGCDTRLSFYYEPIREIGNPIENLAEWVWHMPCNLGTIERIKRTLPMIHAQKPDAIIIHSAAGSRSIAESERMIRDIIKDETGFPLLSIETSMPLQNSDKIKSQIQAFVESNSR